MAHKAESNIFLGSATGAFKGLKININKGEWSSLEKYLQPLDECVLGKTHAVTAMVWGDREENKIIIGHRDQTVKVYDTEHSRLETSFKADIGTGGICGVSQYNGALIMAVQSGHVRVCAQEGKEEYVFETGGAIEKMKHSSTSRNIIATGGKNKDLQLWDLETKKSTFIAKNVRNDELQLRVPVWVNDIDFIKESNRVVYCSRWGHVRVYDPQQQRRPVFNFKIPEKVLTACSVAPDGKIIVVGAGDGYMGAVDVRGKGLLTHRYKGSVGSIRAVAVHPTQPYVFSVGLDQHFKVHNLSTRKLLFKQYLKGKLNCVLPRRDFFYTAPKADSDIEIIETSENEKSEGEEEGEGAEKREYNKLFNNMETVIDSPRPKRRKYQEDICAELEARQK